MSLKHVAYLTPLYFDRTSYLGGGERYPLNLAKAVAATGSYEVELVSYGDAPETVQLSLAPGVTLRVLPSVALRRGGDRVSWEIFDAVRDVDLVHIHQIFSRSSEVALLISKLLHKPVCATDHGGASSELGKSLGMLDLVDRVTCYSRFGASLLETQTQVEVVPGGVDDVHFAPGSRGAERDHVLYVGRLLPHKGIDRLIAAMPDSLPLMICGRPYHEEYYDVLRALAVGKQVEFVTDSDDETLRELYRRALAVVLPSVYVDWYGTTQAWPELMGFSLLEGMACGTPAICSRVGGMPEYVDHGRTGFVYDELAELTGHLEQLAADPALVEALGSEGRRRVAADFGLGPAGARMRGVYDELLTSGHAG